MDIQLIDTGFFHADGGAMFGAIPKTAWNRRYPSDDQNGCILAMRSMLVRDESGKIVLVDNGAGDKHLKQLGYYNFFDLIDLREELGALPVRMLRMSYSHISTSTIADIRHKKKSSPVESLSSKWPSQTPSTG